MNSLFKEISFHINQLNRVQVQFRLLQCLFYIFPGPLPLGSPLSFILHLFLHLYLTRGHLRVYADTCPISLLQKSLGDGYKAENVLFRGHFLINAARELATKHSMWWQQLSLRFFGFPYFLYIYDACPYHQSFLEGHFDHQDLHLIYIQLIQGDIPPRTTFPFVSCLFNPESEPFITIRSSSNYSCSRPRSKALYTNLGPYPYNTCVRS